MLQNADLDSYLLTSSTGTGMRMKEKKNKILLKETVSSKDSE